MLRTTKRGGGNEYVENYKKRTPSESAELVIEKQFGNFVRDIADDYIVRMEALEEARRLEKQKNLSLDKDYLNIADGPIRVNTLPICQKEEPVGWVPKYITPDEDYIVVKDMPEGEEETVIGCGNVKRITDNINNRGTIFIIKDVEFYYPGAYASMVNALINFPTRVKVIGNYSKVTKNFWEKMNAKIDEESQSFELDRNRFMNTKYYKEVR